MAQLTVRGFDDDLERALRGLAQKEGISLNKAALLLMRKGAGQGGGQGPADVIGASLDHLIGTWTPDEEAEFLEAIHSCAQVDQELWR